MRWQTAVAATTTLLVALVLGVVAYDAGLVELPGENAHDRATVTIVDANGTTLATVDASVADTRKERVQGLSDTEHLANGSGMLFVHDSESRRAYVMRDMAYPLDIVFVDADRKITTIHHAALPPAGTPDSDLTRYYGTGKWVLEVPRGFTAAHDVDEGDRVRIRYDD